MASFGLIRETPEMREELLGRFAEIAQEYGISIDACAEEQDFGHLGVQRAHCIDRERIERIGGFKLNVDRDHNQRPACGCVSSIDIGMYNTCLNGCRYCYANYQERLVRKNLAMHDPASPLLFGTVAEGDVIRERKMESLKERQMRLNFVT